MFDKVNKKAKKQENDLTKLRDEKCVPVAKKMLKVIANRELELGQFVTDEKRLECYQPIYQEIVKLFLDAGLKNLEIVYCFTLLKQGIEFTDQLTSNSLQMNFSDASTLLWGKKEEDILLNDVDRVLKEAAEKITK